MGMPRRQRGFESDKKSEVNSRHKRAFDKEGRKFEEAQKDAERVLQSLYRDYKRARRKCKHFELARPMLSEALKALQENESARTRVESARNHLATAEELIVLENAMQSDSHAIRSFEALDDASRRVKDRHRVEGRVNGSLQTAIVKVEELHNALLRAIGRNFGTDFLPTTKETEDDQSLEEFSENTILLLKYKSITDFIMAIYYWELAFEAQKNIYRLYNRKKIYRFRMEFKELKSEVYREESTKASNVRRVKGAAENARQMKSQISDMGPQKKDRKELRRAEHELGEAFKNLTNLKKKIDAARQKKERAEEREAACSEEAKNPRRFGLKRFITGRKETESDVSSSNSIADTDSRESPVVGYPNFY